jgi:hypothetical protein
LTCVLCTGFLICIRWTCHQKSIQSKYFDVICCKGCLQFCNTTYIYWHLVVIAVLLLEFALLAD